MSTYEMVAILRPDLDEETLGAAIDRVHQRIVEHGGAVTTSDRWGKRRIAYPIQKYRDGFYVLTVFTLDSGRVGQLRQTLGLHEDLLRFTVATHRPSPVPAAASRGTAAPRAAAPPAVQPPAGAAEASRGAPSPAPSPAAGSEGHPSAAAPDSPHV